jgi:predicted DsbA family dithiol-disulfide isomerase
MAESKLYDLASEVGVDAAKFKDCYDNQKFAEEVKADITSGQSAGVSGTPGFVIGILKSDGTVEGKRIDGAYPLTQFETIIEEMLAKAG